MYSFLTVTGHLLQHRNILLSLFVVLHLLYSIIMQHLRKKGLHTKTLDKHIGTKSVNRSPISLTVIMPTQLQSSIRLLHSLINSLDIHSLQYDDGSIESNSAGLEWYIDQ